MNEEEARYRLNNNIVTPKIQNYIVSNEFLAENQFKNLEKNQFLENIQNQIRRMLQSIFYSSFFYIEKRQIPENLLSVINYLSVRKLIKKSYFRKSHNDDFPIFRYAIEVDENGVETDGNKYTHNLIGSASDLNSDISVSKAIGEFIERLSLSVYREKNLKKYSCCQLKKRGIKYVDPLSLYTFFKKNKSKIDENTFFLWDFVKDLSGKKYLIPAQAIYWNYRREHPDFVEPILRESNTNGGGAYFTNEKSILSGLYELIQRDAFLRFWLTKTPPPKITNIKSKIINDIVAKANRYLFDIEWYYTSNELEIHTVTCFVYDKTGSGPMLSVGGGSGSSIENSMIGAFSEAISVYGSMRLNKIPKDDLENNVNLGDISHIERLRLWGNYSMKKNLNFFLKGGEIQYEYLVQKNINLSAKDELKEIVRRVENLGDDFKVYIYEVQNEITKDLSFYVSKVIVPGFANLYLNEKNKLSFLRNELSPNGEIKNNIPHPFP